MWHGRKQRLLWCKGKDQAAVASTTTATAAVVAWGGNHMKQCKNQIGKS
jgi:hypothetical protein